MFIYDSPIGQLEIEIAGNKVIRISRIRNKNVNHLIKDDATEITSHVKNWLDKYFDGYHPNHNDLPITMTGTPFQNFVWSVLLTIPYGQTLSYGQIAKMAAKHFGKEKMSAQAVGQAIGKNPLLIVVPCHRVIGCDRRITGFSAGIDVKRWLLDHEAIRYKL